MSVYLRSPALPYQCRCPLPFGSQIPSAVLLYQFRYIGSCFSVTYHNGHLNNQVKIILNVTYTGQTDNMICPSVKSRSEKKKYDSHLSFSFWLSFRTLRFSELTCKDQDVLTVRLSPFFLFYPHSSSTPSIGPYEDQSIKLVPILNSWASVA